MQLVVRYFLVYVGLCAPLLSPSKTRIKANNQTNKWGTIGEEEEVNGTTGFTWLLRVADLHPSLKQERSLPLLCSIVCLEAIFNIILDKMYAWEGMAIAEALQPS